MIQGKQADGGMGLPGLEYFQIKDYLRLFGKNKWLIAVSTFVMGILAAVAGHYIPNVYKSTTVILVSSRKVPDNVVPSAGRPSVAEQLATLRPQVESATRLAQVLNEEQLYPLLRKRKTRDELLELMRGSIKISDITTTSDGGSFKISFEDTDASQSARVANRLASLYIDENTKASKQDLLTTAKFIDHELEEARQDLQEKEDKIRQLKIKNIAELPESQAIHVQNLNTLELTLRGEQEAIDRAQQQKIFYQSQLLGMPSVVNLDREGADSELLPLENQRVETQSQLESLQRRYGPKHPDVIKKAQELDTINAEIRAAKEKGTDRKPAKAEVKHNPVIESQIAAIDDQIEQHNKRISDIKENIAFHESKLANMPVLEQQLAAVNRDYENAISHYKLVEERKYAADTQASLETYQKGERFNVLDLAQPPQKPDRPNRKLIDAAGLFGGLVIGLLIVVGGAMIDSSIKTVAEVKAMGAPVLGEIPVLLTRGEARRARIRNIMGAAGSLACAVLFVALAFVLRHG